MRFPADRTRLGPLGERPFLILFVGRTVSMLGSAIAPVGLAFAVIHLTGSPSDLGLVLAATFVPQVVFLLVGGVWADRLPRHVVMVVSGALAVTDLRRVTRLDEPVVANEPAPQALAA